MVVDHTTLGGLFAPLPPSDASFMALAGIVEDLVSLDTVHGERVQVRSAATGQLLTDLQPTAEWGEIDLPSVPVAADAWEVAHVWVAGLPSSALESSSV